MEEKSAFETFSDSNPYPISYVRFTAPDDSVESQKKRKKQFQYFISGYAARLIRSILDKSGFSETKEIEESLLIVGSALEEKVENELKFYQRTNHYTMTFSLGSKEGYHHLMKYLTSKIGENPSFYPESYLVPNETSELTEKFKTSDYWIRKPAGGARGQGIQVINNEEIPKVLPGRRIIVQRYIKDPLLINGLKFDLRFYVAVTSLDPLRIYLFDNGLVRLATQPYNENIENINELTAHLTNFSINRDEANFVATNDIEKDGTGNKWSHRPFWPYLEQQGFNVEEIKKKIEDAFVQVIIAAHKTFKEQANHRNAFEMFGFDVMLDENQNIYILEVNVTPALGTSSELDRYIKTPLVKDIFNLALIPKTDSRSALQKVETLMGNANIDQENENSNANAEMSDMQKQKLRDVIIVCEYELAKTREGGFHCIWPTQERWDQMKDLLECKTGNDEMLAKWVSMSSEDQKSFLEERFAELRDYLTAE